MGPSTKKNLIHQCQRDHAESSSNRNISANSKNYSNKTFNQGPEEKNVDDKTGSRKFRDTVTLTELQHVYESWAKELTVNAHLC